MRKAEIRRKTGETDIRILLDLDGKGSCQCDTGIGFLDHMISAFARHGFFDVDLKAKGDLQVDGHHTAEDTAIVLGTAIREALGGKEKIARYGHCILPMDDALVICAVDLCGRPYFVFEGEEKITAPCVGGFDTELVREFFYSVSYAAGMNLHFVVQHGSNAHHIIEAMFKAFARALSAACATDPRIENVLSTKGTL